MRPIWTFWRSNGSLCRRIWRRRFNDDFMVHDWSGIFVLLLDFFRFVFRLLISIIFSAIVSGKNFFVVSRNMSWIEKVVEKVGAMDLYNLMSSHFHSQEYIP